MSKFLEEISALIATIHATDPSADISAVKSELEGKINAANDAQDARISDLETALRRTVEQLTVGNVEAATATATEALPKVADAGTDNSATDSATTDAGTENSTSVDGEAAAA